jgi:hypothetical protein
MDSTETEARPLTSSELKLVGGGALAAATSMLSATAFAAKAADFDEGNWCGNGIRPGPVPHVGLASLGAVLGA